MILARYLTRQFIPPFFFGLTLFSGVLLMDKLFDIIDLLVNKGVSLLMSLRIFMLFLPTVLTLTIPMAVLLACLLTFGRLSEDNEITALRAAGLSFSQILWPPLLIAFFLSAALIPFNTLVAPKAISGFRSLYHKIVTADPLIKVEPKQFITMHNVRLYTREVSPDRRSMKDVLLYQSSAEQWQRIYAKRGAARFHDNMFSLSLEQGQIDRFIYKNPQDLMHIQFQRYTFSTPLGGPELSRDKSWRELSLPQLKKTILERKQIGQSTGEVEAEMQLRFAIAFSPLALALLGIPLGITLERGGRGVGFGAAIAVVFIYYLVLIMGLNMAEKDALPAIPALWLANTVTVIIGIILYRRRVML